MMCRGWAEEEFGHAKLGNSQRTRRIVSMAEALHAKPAGKVTEVFPKGKERQGAYKALENGLINADALELARNVACARRMQELGGTFVVAVDRTSVLLSDREGVRNFGGVGNWKWGTRGVQVMTGLALDAGGAPLGVLHQKIWARPGSTSPKRKPGHPSRKRERDPRPPEMRESFLWAETLRQLYTLTAEHAPRAQIWFQLDREGDFWGVHELVAELGVLATVRLRHEHVVRDTDGVKSSLKAWLRDQPIVEWRELHLPAHDGRPPRSALLSMRYGRVRMRLSVPGGTRWVDMSLVYLDEGLRPNAQDRIQWILGTTHPVDELDQAQRVVEAYQRRWRIEDFHRTWKSGTCDIESSQLQSLGSFRRWAILTSSMAARAEHIKHYSREQPDAPATLVFTNEEIETLILWRRKAAPGAKKHCTPNEIPTLAEATRWVAEIGGYTKSRNSAPPGSVTIMRGLEYLETLVQGRLLQIQLSRDKLD